MRACLWHRQQPEHPGSLPPHPGRPLRLRPQRLRLPALPASCITSRRAAPPSMASTSTTGQLPDPRVPGPTDILLCQTDCHQHQGSHADADMCGAQQARAPHACAGARSRMGTLLTSGSSVRLCGHRRTARRSGLGRVQAPGAGRPLYGTGAVSTGCRSRWNLRSQLAVVFVWRHNTIRTLSRSKETSTISQARRRRRLLCEHKNSTAHTPGCLLAGRKGGRLRRR